MCLKSNDTTWEIGTNGNDYWITKNGYTQIRSRTEVEGEKCFEKHRLFSALEALATNGNVNAIPTIFVNGRKLFGIAVRANGVTTNLWIDPNSHFIMRSSFTCPSVVEGFPSTTVIHDYDNYKHVAETMAPMLDLRLDSGIRRAWDSCELLPSSTPHRISEPKYELLPEVIKIPFEIKHGHIMLKGSVDGTPARMLLDTGANFSMMNKSYSEKCKVSLTKEPPSSAVSIFSKYPCFHASASKVALGGLRIQNMPVSVSSRNSEHDIDFYIGMDVLRRYVVRIDFAANTVSFSNDTKPFISSILGTIPLKLQGTPYVTGKLNSKTNTTFLLDCGTPGFAIISNTSISDYADQVQSTGKVKLKNGHTSKIATIAHIQSLELSELTLLRPPVEFVRGAAESREPNNILGLGFLKKFPFVILDFPGEKLILGGPKFPATVDCTDSTRN